MAADELYAVRPLQVEDATAVGAVHIRVWRETYADHMPADYLAALDPRVSAERWRLRAEVDDPQARVLVAVAHHDETDEGAGHGEDEHGEGDEIVGMAAAGVTRDADAPTAWELYSINTIAEVHGSGLADRLLDAALGGRHASLWVLESNARARAFYRRRGFVADGAVKLHEATGLAEVRMVRRLGSDGLDGN